MITCATPTPADADALDAMARDTWVRTFGHGYAPEDLDAYLAQAYGPTGQLRAHLTDPAIFWQVARADGDIVGYAKLISPWVDLAAPGDLQLGQLYVAHDRHGRGVAQTLMDWAIATARARNAPALLLTVFEANHRAIAFYAKYGFVEIGDCDYPVGNQIDRDLILRLAL